MILGKEIVTETKYSTNTKKKKKLSTFQQPSFGTNKNVKIQRLGHIFVG